MDKKRETEVKGESSTLSKEGRAKSKPAKGGSPAQGNKRKREAESQEYPETNPEESVGKKKSDKGKFRCSVCSYTTHSKSNYKKHVRSHSKEKPC